VNYQTLCGIIIITVCKWIYMHKSDFFTLSILERYRNL